MVREENGPTTLRKNSREYLGIKSQDTCTLFSNSSRKNVITFIYTYAMTGVDTVCVQHCFADNHYGASRLQNWAEGQAGLQYPIPFTTVTDPGMDT